MKRFWFLAPLLLGALLIALPIGAQEEAKEKASGPQKPVHVLTMDGAISPAFSGYLESGIRAADEADAQLLLIKLNTPGGLLTSTRDMVSSIVESPVPVAVWVTPSGAHAASAGTFILISAHIAAMDSGTNTGAATPIELGGPQQPAPSPLSPPQEETDKNKDNSEEPAPSQETATDKKALEDTSAFIRGIAEMRGRNAEWAERAVTEAKSVTANEALELNVIDFVATSRAEFLEKADGREIELKNGETVTLELENAPVVDKAPDWRTKILSFLADPNVALILLTIGVYGFIIEFYNPGTLVPATVGAICLIAAMFALNILPVNIAGIILLVVGIILMIAEAFVPSFGILGIGGFIAFIVGATFMFETESMPGMVLDMGVVWGVGISAALVSALVVWMVVRSFKVKTTTGAESMEGGAAEVIEWEDGKGYVKVGGEIWKARSDTKFAADKGENVTIKKVDGIYLNIEKAPE